MDRLRIAFDGLTAPVNPGGVATFGYVVTRAAGREEAGMGVAATGPSATNNLAEYAGVVEGLERVLADEPVPAKVAVEVRGDSELVLRQLGGSYRVRAAHLRPLFERAQAAIRRFRAVSFHWIPREENRVADGLCRAAYLRFWDLADERPPSCDWLGPEVAARLRMEPLHVTAAWSEWPGVDRRRVARAPARRAER